MIQRQISGVGVALITPFNNYEVDYDALGRMVEHVIAGGVDYIVALGSTAETATLNLAERNSVLRFIVERTAGRVPIVAGMSSNDTRAPLTSVARWPYSALCPTITNRRRRASTATLWLLPRPRPCL